MLRLAVIIDKVYAYINYFYFFSHMKNKFVFYWNFQINKVRFYLNAVLEEDCVPDRMLISTQKKLRELIIT